MIKNKNLLIVDMEEIYLTDNDIMGMLDVTQWNSTRQQLKKQYNKIILKIAKLKADGWKIYFTGETKPYEKLIPYIDEILPYWNDNIDLLNSIFKNKSVAITGLFFERCVAEVYKRLKNANTYIIKKMCISHGLIGDVPYYKTNSLTVI